MPKERLLKRIRNWEKSDGALIAELDLSAYIQSLMDDLSKIYNTRQGTVMLDAKFGIPDFTSLMSTMAPPEIENLTRSFILVTNEYEPRLKNLNVTYTPKEEDRGLIRFSIKTKVNFRGFLTPLKFDVLLQGDGSVVLQIQE